MPGLRRWGVESERDMYYATKRSNTTTRAIGVVGVVLGLGVSGYALANGLGIIETNDRVETEVVMIEELEEIVEDGAIVGVVESFEDSILVVDGVDGVEGFVASSRSPQSREALRDEASSRGLFAIEWIVEGGLVVARRSSK